MIPSDERIDLNGWNRQFLKNPCEKLALFGLTPAPYHVMWYFQGQHEKHRNIHDRNRVS
jgi:hypothetical protein